MPWAVRRRVFYISGILIFFGVTVGIPLIIFSQHTPTCTDGIQNQGETDVDKGGPCPLLDERMLAPEGILWARSFRVRDGSYNAAAYIQNSNQGAGILPVNYRFRLYDAANVLVAEREGKTFVMPSGVTPVFEPHIQTGNRIVTHTFFEFTGPVIWARAANAAAAVDVSNREVKSIDTVPHIAAKVENTSVSAMLNLSLVVVVFDTAGNAFAASKTLIQRLSGSEKLPIVFTWPDPFTLAVGRIDIIPVLPPAPVTP